MSRRHHKRSHAKEAKEAKEHRAVEILTIGWVLTVMTALACEIGSLAATAAVSYFGAGDAMTTFAGLLLFAAVAIGFIALMMTPVVLKSLRAPTPRAVVVMAVCAGILPMLTLFWQFANGP